MRPILVSACLLGLATRYDGTSKSDARVLALFRDPELIPVPVCPEQLAGLPTPRKPCRFARGDGRAVLDGQGLLLDADGASMNEVFLKGAVETLKVARLTGCREALLKERSPSCGVSQIHLDDTLVSGQGITAALLERNGLSITSEESLAKK